MIEAKAKAWISLEFEIEFETQVKDGIDSGDVDSDVLEQLKAGIRKCELSLHNIPLESCCLIGEDYDLKEVTLHAPAYDADDKADDERMERKLESIPV